MIKRYPSSESRNSLIENNIKNLLNSLENFIYTIKEFYKSLELMRKREKDLKNKYYYNFLCFSLCLKKKYKNDRNILEQIEDIEEDKKVINDKLEKLSDNYMSRKETIIKELFSCISMKSFLILLLSILHFYAIAEVNGFLFSLFGEIKRSSYHYFHGNYTTNKTFEDFFINSTLTDSSQINFNYFTSILTSFFICKYSIMTLYFFSTIGLIVIIYLVSNFKFLTNHVLYENKNYPFDSFLAICIFYGGIYFFAGLIALLPYELLKKNNRVNSWDLLLMNFFLTFSVIIKNLLHDKISIFKYPYICGRFYVGASLVFFIYPFIIWIQNKANDQNESKRDSDIISTIYRINESIKTKYNDIENSGRISDLDINTSKKDDKSNISDTSFAGSNDSFIEMNSFDEESLYQSEELIPDKSDRSSKEIIEKKSNYNLYYIFGVLIIKFEHFIITATIKTISSYIWMILKDEKIIMILLINLFSRTQKLKFKTIYKKEFNTSIYYLIGNFSLSYFILFIFSIIFYFREVRNHKEKNNNKLLEKKEFYIINAVIIDNTIVFIFSILNIVFPNPIFSYLCISIGGNFNFLLYEYYSTVEKDYISISGFISLAQILFRIIELIFEPCEDYWLYIQIGISIASIITSCYYIKKCLNEENKEEEDVLDNSSCDLKNIIDTKFYLSFFGSIIIISACLFFVLSR